MRRHADDPLTRVITQLTQALNNAPHGLRVDLCTGRHWLDLLRTAQANRSSSEDACSGS